MVDGSGGKIVILGSGNVATHLAQALDRKYDVVSVFSRDIGHAESLARRLRCAVACDDLSAVSRGADLYLVSVNDDAIREVAETIKFDDGIWAHTSGSVPSSVFEGLKKRYGVFYPLQTFNRDKAVDVSEVPLFVEGNNENVTGKLLSIASAVSSRVGTADSVLRKRMHLAAVFACNFVNRLYGIAEDILRDGGLDLSVLEPLMKVSLENAVKYGADNVQTGPARRGDRGIIESQMSSLDDDDARAIYRVITDSIMKKYRVNQ